MIVTEDKNGIILLFLAIPSRHSTQDVSSLKVELAEASEALNGLDTIGSEAHGPRCGMCVSPIEQVTSAAARAVAEASDENALWGVIAGA